MFSILSGIARIYAWILGVGIPTLILISLVQSAADLVRERRHGRLRVARPVLFRHRA